MRVKILWMIAPAVLALSGFSSARADTLIKELKELGGIKVAGGTNGDNRLGENNR
jgi:hypothetical protein